MGVQEGCSSIFFRAPRAARGTASSWLGVPTSWSERRWAQSTQFTARRQTQTSSSRGDCRLAPAPCPPRRPPRRRAAAPRRGRVQLPRVPSDALQTQRFAVRARVVLLGRPPLYGRLRHVPLSRVSPSVPSPPCRVRGAPRIPRQDLPPRVRRAPPREPRRGRGRITSPPNFRGAHPPRTASASASTPPAQHHPPTADTLVGTTLIDALAAATPSRGPNLRLFACAFDDGRTDAGPAPGRSGSEPELGPGTHILHDPVVLACGHAVCRGCERRRMGTSPGTRRECPRCGRPDPTEEAPPEPSLLLAELVRRACGTPPRRRPPRETPRGTPRIHPRPPLM